MSPATFTAAILGDFTAGGFIGSGAALLATAIGTGAMLEILGKPFDTIDVGTQIGPGAGTAVGLTGIVGSIVSAQILLEMLASGFITGPDSQTMADAIGDSLESEVALATLATLHNPMAVGSATITPGSIGVDGGDVGGSIESAAPAFIGDDWPDLAAAIGTGIGDAFLLANAVITVLGAPVTPPPPAPFSGPNLTSPAGVLL